MNKSLKDYHTSLGGAHLQILGGTLTLTNLIVVQDAHPVPPVAHIPVLQISIQWRELLTGHIVAYCLVDRPDVHIDLVQLSSEHSSKLSLRQRGWQDAIQRIYPFKINQFHLHDGTVTYVDTDPAHALHLEQVNFVADNIRNIRLPDGRYPSSLAATALVFGTGQASVQGRADFLAKPAPGLLVGYRLEHVPLAALEPGIKRLNLAVTGGSLDSDGVVEYSAGISRVEVRQATIDSANAVYIHQSATARAEARRGEEIAQAAERANNASNLILTVHQANLIRSTLAYRDDTSSPGYRIFIDKLDMSLSNLSNQWSQGASSLNLDGQFMGSGKTHLTGMFRPHRQGPDFELNLAAENTELASLNSLLRRYGGFDVRSGLLSVYAQLAVRDSQITGYVKPLFSDLQVYDYQKDEGKPLLHQAYELAVGGAAKLLKNRSTKAVATEVNFSGRLPNPTVSTIQALMQLAENAFITAILPGFNRQEKAIAGQSY